MRFLKSAVVLLLFAGVIFAQQQPAPAASTPVQQVKPTSDPKNPPSSGSGAAAAIPGFDIDALDRSIDPCVDFYRFACGTWMAKNPIPGDESRWGRFNELALRNREVLHQILEGVAAPNPKRSALEQKIGDYYASCMDENAISALGVKPIQSDLNRIAAIKDRTGLIDTVAYLNTVGVRGLFGFFPMADMHDATMTIANVDQGGLSLPDRDYYLKIDPKTVETREKYLAHVQKMFELLGDKPETAAAEAKTVLSVETELAKAAMDRTERRDPNKRDHKMSVAELQALAPNFEFTRYFAGVSAPKFETLNVGNPEFFKSINTVLNTVPVADWRVHLRWHLLRSSASMLPKPFVEEEFNFWRHYLAGQKEMEPRWKRCVASTDMHLGEALGEIYVDRTFGVEGKQRTLKMVEAIEKAMGDDIRSLAWMTDTTKQAAHGKLAKIANNIGYPDKWRNYSTVKVVRGDAIGNMRRAASFETQRQINKIGKPVDRKEWGMTPPTVNAYYRPSNNDINFPAGILQPPFFDSHMDDAVNFGGIGSVIGHELTHGFDDQGAKFDPVGNLSNWWSPQDLAEFQKRSDCIADEYSGFVAVAEVHLNGRLTLGENTADNGGVRLSYMALQDRLKTNPQTSLIDGFTPEQRFFLGYAQIWCQNVTPENSRMLAKTDPHSPGQYRVNGVVVNMPEFQKAFSCKAGQPMVSANACRTW
jgi:endothelin-converting enzyme/putative endopeptidase